MNITLTDQDIEDLRGDHTINVEDEGGHELIVNGDRFSAEDIDALERGETVEIDGDTFVSEVPAKLDRPATVHTMSYPTHTIIIEIPAANVDAETAREAVSEALTAADNTGFRVGVESRPGEVYTVNVKERDDGLYVFSRLQDRDLFAAVFDREDVEVGTEPVFGPEAIGDLIAAEED